MVVDGLARVVAAVVEDVEAADACGAEGHGAALGWDMGGAPEPEPEPAPAPAPEEEEEGDDTPGSRPRPRPSQHQPPLS